MVLAAGASRRLGRSKQQLMLAGERLVDRAARVAAEAGLSPVFVVVARQEDAAQAATTVLHTASAEGMSSSLRAGVQAVLESGASGVVVMTCDQAGQTPNHLRALCSLPELRCASGYAARRGVPAYFPREDFPALLRLSGDEGARSLLRDSRAVYDEALALDIDTEEAYRRAQALYG